jgi:hypothetical protein
VLRAHLYSSRRRSCRLKKTPSRETSVYVVRMMNWRRVWTAYNSHVGEVEYTMILSRVLVTERGFGLVIGCINRLRMVITINHNTSWFSLYKHSTPIFWVCSHLSSLCFLATDLNTGIITDSHIKYYTWIFFSQKHSSQLTPRTHLTLLTRSLL